MKQTAWIRSLLIVFLAVIIACPGALKGAGAEGAGTIHTDSQGNQYRIVPLGDGTYELWMLVSQEAKDVSLAEVQYPEGKNPGDSFSPEDISRIGLEGLTEGKDYVRTVESRTDDDGLEWWVITDEATGGNKGRKVTEVLKGTKAEGVYSAKVIYAAVDGATLVTGGTTGSETVTWPKTEGETKDFVPVPYNSDIIITPMSAILKNGDTVTFVIAPMNKPVEVTEAEKETYSATVVYAAADGATLVTGGTTGSETVTWPKGEGETKDYAPVPYNDNIMISPSSATLRHGATVTFIIRPLPKSDGPEQVAETEDTYSATVLFVAKDGATLVTGGTTGSETVTWPKAEGETKGYVPATYNGNIMISPSSATLKNGDTVTFVITPIPKPVEVTEEEKEETYSATVIFTAGDGVVLPSGKTEETGIFTWPKSEGETKVYAPRQFSADVYFSPSSAVLKDGDTVTFTCTKANGPQTGEENLVGEASPAVPETEAETPPPPPDDTDGCDHKGYGRRYEFQDGNWQLVHNICCENCGALVGQESCSLETTGVLNAGEDTRAPEGGLIRTCKFCKNGIVVSNSGIVVGFVTPVPPGAVAEETPEATPEPPAETLPPNEQAVSEKECQHLVYAWGSEGIRHPQFHWKECLECGKTLEPEPHVYDRITVVQAATCKTDAVLERKCACGRVDEGNTTPQESERAAHPEWFAHHTWGSEYSHDYLGHWRLCTVCGERSNEENHMVSNLSVHKEADCIRNAVVNFECSVCGEHLEMVEANDDNVKRYPVLSEYQAKRHDYTGELKPVDSNRCTKREEGTHAHTCTRCGSLDRNNATPHSWKENTFSNGTCEDENDPVIIEGTCACGATLTLSYTRHHSWVKDSSQDVQPTCIEPGKINGERCRFCGTFGNYDFVEAEGHEWYEYENERTEPTCTELGWSHWFCAKCGWEEWRGIHFLSPFGHHEFERYAPLGDSSVCLGKGSWLMKCKYCDTYDDHGLYTEDKLAHDTYSVTKDLGGQKLGTTRDGLPMVGQTKVTTIKCRRCNRTLGVEYETVWKSMRGNRFQIVPGKGETPPTLDRNDGATVVTGQMGRDKGVYFESQVDKALGEYIKERVKEYDYAE